MSTFVYILVAVLVFGVLIAVHELGHFLAAKACGVRVNEFSIGMGPAIFKKKKGDTLYSLRCLPFGGFCAMEGEDEASTDPAALENQGFWAKLLCRFVHVTPAGPGAGTPHKMQLIIMICGLPRVLLAAFCSAVTKLFGKKGVFYKVCGHEVDGIDGLIDYDISFKEYVDYGILNPENPSGVCDEIYEKTGVKAMIIDASDIDCVILGKCRNVTLTDEQLCEIVRDNPAGQEGQCTPFILIRKKA